MALLAVGRFVVICSAIIVSVRYRYQYGFLITSTVIVTTVVIIGVELRDIAARTAPGQIQGFQGGGLYISRIGYLFP